MKKIVGVLLMAGSLFYFSCGNSSEKTGMGADEEQNTTGGVGTGTTDGSDMNSTGGSGMDTTSGNSMDTTGSSMNGANNSNQMNESTDSTGNFHSQQKGGSTPADKKGNY